MGEVIQHPTADRAPVRQSAPRAVLDRAGNVVPIRRPRERPEREAMPPSGYAILAIIAALEARKGHKHMREDVFRAVMAMRETFEDEPEIRSALAWTVNLLCARKDGRW